MQIVLKMRTKILIITFLFSLSSIGCCAVIRSHSNLIILVWYFFSAPFLHVTFVFDETSKARIINDSRVEFC